MTPSIRTFPSTTLIGISLTMSMIQDQTRTLWATFGPRTREIEGRDGADLYSIQVFPEGYFQQFDPNRTFEKWAAVPVSGNGSVPVGMQSIVVQEGKYAVFTYRGKPSEGGPFFQALFSEWLPNAGLLVDDRPHFAIMGEKYKGEHPDSEEEIWIPVK